MDIDAWGIWGQECVWAAVALGGAMVLLVVAWSRARTRTDRLSCAAGSILWMAQSVAFLLLLGEAPQEAVPLSLAVVAVGSTSALSLALAGSRRAAPASPASIWVARPPTGDVVFVHPSDGRRATLSCSAPGVYMLAEVGAFEEHFCAGDDDGATQHGIAVLERDWGTRPTLQVRHETGWGRVPAPARDAPARPAAAPPA